MPALAVTALLAPCLAGSGMAAGGPPVRPELVSVSSHGGRSNGESVESRASADGRFVAFASYASNLVPRDTNGTSDIFVRDPVAGTTRRVSVSNTGAQANDFSFDPDISADGRYVAFSSDATNLLDRRGPRAQVYVRDLAAGRTIRVSVTTGGRSVGQASFDPSISADGRYVAFDSQMPRPAPRGGLVHDVFVRDRVRGTTTRVSSTGSGGLGDDSSYNPSISGDGRYVAFMSTATNLVPGDTNRVLDVLVHDRATHTTRLASIDPAGHQLRWGSAFPRMSLDGHFVVFEGQSSRTRNEVMIRNLVTGTTTLVSMAVDGRPAVDGGSTPSVSAHGRFVAFSSRDEALVAGDTNGEEDVFVRDLARRTTVLISRPGAGRQGDGASRYPHISADGSLVTFASYADNLVPRDTNGEQDVFARVLTR